MSVMCSHGKPLGGTMTTTGAENPSSAPLLPERMARVAEMISRATRMVTAIDTIVRPHPLLVVTSREGLMVVLAPSEVWDSSRELLKPFADHFASSSALMILLGVPKDKNLSQVLNRGLASIIPEN